MTLRDYMRRVHAHRRQQKGLHEQQLDQWRQTRFLATILLNVNRGEKTPPFQPQDVLWLPGDPPPTPPMDEDEFAATMARLAESE